MWPRGDQPQDARPVTTRRAERGLRVRQPSWNEVSKSGGVWAAMLREAGHTCDRVPVAIDFERCVDAKWCYTGCVFGAKNSLITNYLPSAERRGVEVRPLVQVNEVAPSSRPPVPLAGPRARRSTRRRRRAPSRSRSSARSRSSPPGALGTPPILMRSRDNGALPSISPHLGRHLGVNGDHVAAIEVDSRKAERVLGLPGGYDEFFKGKPITTMSYDHWVGKRGNAHDGTRFTLQEILLSASSPTSSTTTAAATAPSRPGGVARRSARSRPGRATSRSSRWSRRRWTGTFYAVPPGGNGHVQPNGGPVGIGLFNYDALRAVGRGSASAPNAGDQGIAERRGVGRFLKLAETPGVYAVAPARRRADGRRRSASGSSTTAARCSATRASTAWTPRSIPTSFGVNPSLSISAVCERAAAKLVARADDFGLPAPPAGLKHRPPGVHVGPRVHPGR